MKTIETTNRLPLIATLSVLIRVALITGLLALAGVLNAQDLNNENFVNLDEFTKIEISGAFDVTLIQSDVHKISKNENAKFEINDGTLKILFQDRSHNKNNLTIYFKSLEILRLLGAVDLVSKTPISGEHIEINMIGASDATLILEYNVITTVLNGAATLNVSGTAETHTIRAFGAADVKAKSLKTKSTNVVLSGAADARIDAETITGNVSGASTLIHNPDAKSEVSKSGAGSIRSLNTTSNGSRTSVTVNTSTKKKGKSIWNPKYGALDLGWSGYGQDFFRNTLPEDYEDMKLKGNTSFAVNLNAFRYAMGIGGRNSNFAVGTGFGIGWNIYKFLEESMIPMTDRENRQFTIKAFDEPENREFKRSKLQSSWLKVPLYLQYANRKFFMTAGVVGNVRIGASTKQVFELNGSKQRRKTKDNFYLNAFRADAEMRVGYGSTSVFATYSLTPMFLEGKGPELMTYTFGISLGINN
jgi:hypothetical protein